MKITDSFKGAGILPATRIRVAAVLVAAVGTLAACNSDRLNITNPNIPTVEGAASDPQALQLLASGLLRQLRNGRGAYISSVGRFGRESYIYSPQEGRNTSAYLIGISGQNKIDPAGFAVENWATQYGNLRDIFNFKNTAGASATLTAAQKSASIGFAKTLEALELLYVISTRDTIGAVVEIKLDASVLSAFVSRDSVYKYILNTLDAAATDLGAGGAAFPFTLHSGFTGFNTPATFLTFNRAITARAASYYATAGGGPAAWQKTLTALTASFLNTAATTRAALDVGVYHPYSTATGDANNPLNAATNTDLYAHPSTETDAPLKVGGAKDDRFTAKVGTRVTRSGPNGLGIASSIGYNLYPTASTSIPVVRNEELMLIRAEALLATGDKAGAISIINSIRVNSGGLAASALTAASSDDAVLNELLLQKRYSLLLEGNRWVDLRRYNKLNTLPIDITTGTNAHFIARVQPVPQAECLSRVQYPTGPLHAPGCP